MITVTKPPDKYKTFKIPLNVITRNDINVLNETQKNIIDDIIFNTLENTNELILHTVSTTHHIVIHVMQLLRLWILDLYKNNKPIPEITEEIIQMAFKALVYDSRGPKAKGENKSYLDIFNKFYNKHYKYLGMSNKLNGSGLSQIIRYSSISILTAIENNIKANFINYLNRFINSSFKLEHSNILSKVTGNEKYKLRKQLRKELYQVKQDMLNNTKTSDNKYHKWIDEQRNKVLPSDIENVQTSDIHNEPQKFIKYMIYMNKYIETIGCKMFQFFPLRTNIIPKYIMIDTKSLIEIFINNNVNNYLTKIESDKKDIWNTFFKLEHKIFSVNNYSFDYSISTDGYTASIRFIHNSFLENQKETNKKKKEGRAKARICNAGKTQEEKDKIKQDEKNVARELKKKISNDKKEREKNLTKEEKRKINEEKKKLKEEKKKKEYIEFPYLDELPENLYDKVKSSNKIYNDPGKGDLFAMIDDNGKFLRYSNKQRIHETKRLKYGRYLKNYKDKHNISNLENKLSKYNSKTCDLEKFKEYIANKNKYNNLLFKDYEASVFRKYKWYLYINTKRSEDNLLNLIENTFGKGSIMIIGDWCVGKQLRNFISTPMISLKRKLKERFMVINLDEYNTSKINCYTGNKNKNLTYIDKKNNQRKIHSVLTYSMENNRKGCINRNLNSVLNYKKIVECWFKDKSRPEKFTRTKVTNPIELPTMASSSNTPSKVQ